METKEKIVSLEILKTVNDIAVHVDADGHLYINEDEEEES